MDDALEVDVLAASLKLEGAQAADLMEHLAKKLQLALPDHVVVKREGWVFSASRPVVDILVRFEESHFQLKKEEYGPIKARKIKIVRGVALKATDVTFDQWINNLAGEMSALAGENMQAREGMSKLVQ
jgi:hypothetical protein